MIKYSLDLTTKQELRFLSDLVADLRAEIPKIDILLVGAMARDLLRSSALETVFLAATGCRYVARPAVATERLSILPDGRVSYRLRHKWRDGTTHVLFEPLELVEKLAALVPPPRFNLVRYSGIFAPAACWRSQIVPFVQEESGSVHHGGCGGKRRRENPDGKDFQKPSHCHPRNYS